MGKSVCLILQIFLSLSAQAETYRACVANVVKTQIKKTPCNYQAAQGAASIAQNACMNAVLDEVLKDKSIRPASDEFINAIKIKQVSGSSDAREMIIAEGKRCGDDVTISSDGSGSSKRTSTHFSFGLK